MGTGDQRAPEHWDWGTAHRMLRYGPLWRRVGRSRIGAPLSAMLAHKTTDRISPLSRRALGALADVL